MRQRRTSRFYRYIVPIVAFCLRHVRCPFSQSTTRLGLPIFQENWKLPEDIILPILPLAILRISDHTYRSKCCVETSCKGAWPAKALSNATLKIRF